ERDLRCLASKAVWLHSQKPMVSRRVSYSGPEIGSHDMNDLYAQVTTRIIGALEAGVAPWVRPWSTGADTLPMNAGTHRPYRGINVLLLGLEAQAHGYPFNRWLTYRQADELGGQVRRGEQGTTVVFWKLRKVAATAETYPAENEPDLP